MVEIRLPGGVWFYDPTARLGAEGGFGCVYQGHSETHSNLAVKRLKLEAEQAAHRELRIASELQGHDLTYVIPVLDAGQDAESGGYFVVMAKADRSLQDEIDQGSTCDSSEAAAVMLQIAKGLDEVPDIVHRDLKPGNVLLHEGKWKVADFGIARFAEESTSLATLKDWLSRDYAAPEQWRAERASHSTDIYALGCIAYALLTGQPPFTGQSREDLREQHLSASPPTLPSTVDSRLRTLTSSMLRKLAESRPSRNRAREVLQQVCSATEEEHSGSGFRALAEAGADVAQREAAEERERVNEASVRASRQALATQGYDVLKEIIEGLFGTIERTTPSAQRIAAGRHTSEVYEHGITMGSARLHLHIPRNPIGSEFFDRSGWKVVNAGAISVHQTQPPYKWSSSLLYASRPGAEEYRWYEVSFFTPHRGEDYTPYALTHDLPHAAEALAPGLGEYQPAFGPVAIDDEDADSFSNRWALLLAKASQGELSRPRSLPLPPRFFE